MFTIETLRAIDPTTKGIENRDIYKELSPELMQLGLFNLDLLNIDHGNLCIQSPVNFVGALIAQELAQELNMLYANYDQPPLIEPDHITRVLPHVEIYNTDNGNTWDIPIGPSGRVLYKGECGRNSGLVLDGPYAGLLLKGFEDNECYDTHGYHDMTRMRAIRILNDEFFSTDVLPYQILLKSVFENPYHHHLFQQSVLYRYAELALKTYGLQTQGLSITQMQTAVEKLSGQDIRLVDMISTQCQRLGIPFDKASLHCYSPRSST